MITPSNELEKFTQEINELIEHDRQLIARSVNVAMSHLYWKVGNKINLIILKNERGAYGKGIVVSLARQLVRQYGTSFSEKNLRRMMQFAMLYQDEEIVVSVIRQLSWTHILVILPIKESLKREFYTQLCIHENWSVRTFRERIKSMFMSVPRSAESRKKLLVRN
ncbi:MAG: DUF1016 N-terminal domain-containing protein [Bacteroidota bacterium]